MKTVDGLPLIAPASTALNETRRKLHKLEEAARKHQAALDRIEGQWKRQAQVLQDGGDPVGYDWGDMLA